MLTAGSKILRTNFTGSNFEPSVRLLWTPTDKQTFWAAFTHALRTPSDAEERFLSLELHLGLGQRNAVLCALQRQSGFRAGTAQRLRTRLPRSCSARIFTSIWPASTTTTTTCSAKTSPGIFLEYTLPFPAPAAAYYICCCRRSSATACTAPPREWRSRRNGGPRISGGCEDRIRICI